MHVIIHGFVILLFMFIFSYRWYNVPINIELFGIGYKIANKIKFVVIVMVTLFNYKTCLEDTVILLTFQSESVDVNIFNQIFYIDLKNLQRS